MSFRRIWHLFMIDVRLLFRRWVWVMLLLALVLLVLSFGMGWLRSLFPTDIQATLYLGLDMFLLGGMWCFLSSLAFSDLHTQGEGFYLLLPASSLEKFVSKLLGSLVVYPLMGFVVLFFYSLVIMLIVYYLTGTLIPVFFPFYGWLWQWYLFFFVLQAWFFWGSVRFSHFAFVKTMLLLFGMSFLLSFLSTPVLQFLFGTVVSWNGIVLYSTRGIVPPALARDIFDFLLWLGRVLFFLSAGLAYGMAYRHFVRYEVTHGV
ncbi:MAG: hypothetical protein N2314_07115 [Brevinematales bacterium]|nr:hypothetical protein [Brevinematales bacterium]